MHGSDEVVRPICAAWTASGGLGMPVVEVMERVGEGVESLVAHVGAHAVSRVRSVVVCTLPTSMS